MFPMLLSFLFYAFLVYLAWKIIFGLVIPLYRTTRRVKKSFREMQERMNQAQSGFGAGPVRDRQPEPSPQKGAEPGDYIEFEEVR